MIDRVRIYAATVPMAKAFDHASHARRRAESVLVEVTTVDGVTGWGEGAPRGYVTGESLESVVTAVEACDPAEICDRIDWSSFDAAISSVVELCDAGILPASGAPAAACAVETALLDTVARGFGRPLSDTLQAVLPDGLRRPRPAEVSVSLVIALSQNVRATLLALAPTTRAALRYVKIKVNEAEKSAARLADAREVLGAETQIFLDVNGAWSPMDAEKVAPELMDLAVAWIEEPLPPRSWTELAGLRERTGLPIMLDESCCTSADLDRAAELGAATHINVRLSKCGGVFASARLAARARAAGLGCQLGVHVAEVGPLWAVGRALAFESSLWQTVEAGRGDEWFPTPLTDPAFSVDRARYRVSHLEGPGSGVVPSAKLLEQVDCRGVWQRGTGWRGTAA